MLPDRTLEALWDSAPLAEHTFDPATIEHLPPAARRYLLAAIAPGAPLATAARVEMHGTIKLGGEWLPFEAEQVLRWDRGFVWHARVVKGGLPVTGFDRWIDGEGAMRWRLLGIVPVVKEEGADVTRSAAGRMNIEAIWLPPVLLSEQVTWTEEDAHHAHARVTAHGEDNDVRLTLDEDGALRAVQADRWGDPDEDGRSERVPFGGLCSGAVTFDGITLPRDYRIGWYFGTDRFETEGEFFRCTVDRVTWR